MEQSEDKVYNNFIDQRAVRCAQWRWYTKMQGAKGGETKQGRWVLIYFWRSDDSKSYESDDFDSY